MTDGSTSISRVLVSGASGLIGTSLIRTWMRDRIGVVRLLRHAPGAAATGRGHAPASLSLVTNMPWDPGAASPLASPGELSEIEAAVHLSGAPVAGSRWTERSKQEILSSRVRSTAALAKLLTRIQPQPKVLVCASAIGIYGDRGDEILTERSAPGTGFLAETCVAWEAAARIAEDAGIRVVYARFGVVLAREGGALGKMLPLFRLGLGGKLGNGRSWMPWITLPDTIGAIQLCIDNEALRGPVNVVAPGAVRNEGFTQALGAAVHRPAILPAPAFALRVAFGEMADEALLASARVVPAELLRVGYRFADPEIGPALRNMLQA